MKNKFLAYLFSFLFAYSLNSESIDTKNFIKNSKWSEEGAPCGGLYLNFFEKHFEASEGCLGTFLKIAGNFNVDKKYIHIGEIKILENQHLKDKAEMVIKYLNNSSCIILINEKSVKYAYTLACGKLNFNNDEHLVTEGLKRDLNGISVVTMGGKEFETSENVKIREKPDVNSKSVGFSAQFDEAPLPFVPKGVKVKVFARKVMKDQIKNWHNYWYFVDVGNNTGVWMFGEFLK